jgi:hypothetical protein
MILLYLIVTLIGMNIGIRNWDHLFLTIITAPFSEKIYTQYVLTTISYCITERCLISIDCSILSDA